MEKLDSHTLSEPKEHLEGRDPAFKGDPYAHEGSEENPHVRKKIDTLIILPALNEEKNIGKVIDAIQVAHRECDILVINDGSQDKTQEVVEAKEVYCLHHIFNMGIGASFETGCQFAVENGYQYIVRMDADGQHDARFIEGILDPLKNDEVDIVIGSRFLGNSEFKSSPSRLIGIKIISAVLSLMSRKRVTDPTSGFCGMNLTAFSFFSKNCAEDYPEPEILVYHKDFRIKEVPISIFKRHSGASSITPLRSIFYMLKVLLSLFVSYFKR